MPNITADKVLNKDLYAKSNVNVLSADLKTVKKTIPAGALIGNVYSYVTGNDGSIYWMFYLTNQDYNNFNASYVKHDASALSLPALPDILAQIESENRAKQIADKGIVSYYIEKYAPWIVGGVVAAVALPSLTKSLSSNKVGYMSKKNEGAILLIGSAVAIYILTQKKRKGSVEVGPLDPGEFVPDQLNTGSGSGSIINKPADPFNNGRIQYIGIMPVTYEDQQPGSALSGKQKNDLGKIQSC